MITKNNENLPCDYFLLIQEHLPSCGHAQIRSTNSQCKMSERPSVTNVKCNYCGKNVPFASIKVSSAKILFKNNPNAGQV